MGIDYVVDLDCAAKRLLSTEGILRMRKARSRGEAVLRLVRDAGDTRPTSAITFQIVLRTPAGDEPTTVSVQDLLDQAAPLDGARGGCAACPANDGDPEGYGCFRWINYPIEESTEAWLLDRLPDDPDSMAGQLLRRAFADFGWDGAQAAVMRGHSDTFFACRQPMSRTWDDGFTLTADQIFHMLFHVGPIGSTHALMVVLFLGALPPDLDLDILTDPTRRIPTLSLAMVAPQDEAIEPVADLIRALILATRLDVDIIIDG